MNTKTAFCEYCRKDVLYIEKEEYMSAELKGETYKYCGKTAICDECSNEIFVSEINDYNLRQLYNEFRKQNNIISLDKILEISPKYNIGKRPLSLLLGWGELTFSRYCDGDMPTQQYSTILQMIYDDPNYYLSILKENKENLKSNLSYHKSKQTTQMLLGITQVSDKAKIDIVVDYLLDKCEDITPLALQKLLYYVQGFYYAFMNFYIIEDDCEAWVHGPVFKDIYNKYKEYKFDPIGPNDMVDDSQLSVNEKVILDSVIKNLSCYSGKTLEAFTHSETPWLSTRGDLPTWMLADRVIGKQLIGDYFKAVKEKNGMINPSDIGVYSKKMFEQIFT